jgi:hypothetical protein
VLLPAAGAVLAAATPSTLDEDIGYKTGWSGGKAKGETDTAEIQKKQKRKVRKKNQMTTLIGNKRQ